MDNINDLFGIRLESSTVDGSRFKRFHRREEALNWTKEVGSLKKRLHFVCQAFYNDVMIQAKHVMHLSTPVISYEATILEAIEAMKKSPAGFVASMASSDRYLGVLTEAALIRMYLKYQIHKDRDQVILYRDMFEPMQLIHESEMFPELVKKLLTSVGQRVFVINDDGTIVGYITTKDILPYFTEGTKESLSASTDTLKSDLYLFESFFEKSPFMMHSVNKDGVIQMANEILHDILGYGYGELIGKTISHLYSKENSQKAEEGIKTIFKKGYHQVVRSQMMTKTGTPVEVELVSRVLTNQFDSPVGTMTVSRPVDMALLLKNLPQA